MCAENCPISSSPVLFPSLITDLETEELRNKYTSPQAINAVSVDQSLLFDGCVCHIDMLFLYFKKVQSVLVLMIYE